MPSSRRKELAVARAALLALVSAVALLHALFVAGPGHIATLDSDGCFPRASAAAQAALDTCCGSAAAEVAPMGRGHQPDSGATSCDASIGLQAKSVASTPHPAVLARAVTVAHPGHLAEPQPALAGADSTTPSPNSVLRC